jgi:hypothetical protein
MNDSPAQKAPHFPSKAIPTLEQNRPYVHGCGSFVCVGIVHEKSLQTTWQ